MMKLVLGLLLVCLICACVAPAGAQDTVGKIVPYFDAEGTQRYAEPTGAGNLVYIYIFVQDFPGWIGGAQYRIDYGPYLRHITDIGMPPVTIGNSANGVSIGFGRQPIQFGKRLMHTALCEWTTDCTTMNVDRPKTAEHPDFPDNTPMVVRFWHNDIWLVEKSRSQTCQLVELDIEPESCPNKFDAKNWRDKGKKKKLKKGDVLPVAVLGSSTVDVRTIDVSSLLLEGVPPILPGQSDDDDDSSGKRGRNDYGPSVVHAGVADGSDECECYNESDDDDSSKGKRGRGTRRDDYKDLLLNFSKHQIALAIGAEAPPRGTEVALTLTGAYEDGLPFEAKDCIVIKGGRKLVQGDDDDDDESSRHAGRNDGRLLDPRPNPFNPVTRIGYVVTTTQHVRIAVYDVAGRLVESLVDEVKGAGEHVVEWDAGTLPSGVYFYRMQVGGQTFVRRATLIK